VGIRRDEDEPVTRVGEMGQTLADVRVERSRPVEVDVHGDDRIR